MPEYKQKNKKSHYKVDDLEQVNKKVEQIDPDVKYVVDCWDSWDSFWGNKLNEFEGFYDRWNGNPPKRDEEWQAQYHKRLTWQAEKSLVARYYSTLFPVSAPIESEAVETQDELQRILAKSIVSHWFKIGRFSKEFLSSMRSAAIYGTGLFEDDWYVRKEYITERVDKRIPDYRSLVDLNGNKLLDSSGNIQAEQVGFRVIQSEEEKLKIVEDRYRLKKANIFAWRIHPFKLDDDDDYPAIKQEYVTFDDLKERQAEAEKYGFNKFENIDILENEKSNVNSEQLRRLQKEGDYNDDKNPRIELLHYWGLYEDKGKRKPMWITIANRKYRLWKRENPYWHKKPPLFHIVWTEDEKPSYYGKGIAEIGKDAEDRANDTINIRTDIKKKNARGGGWYNSLDKKIKKSDLQKNIPGLYKACSDVNNAVRPDMPVPLLPEDYQEEITAVNDHREVTGASSALLPTENQKNRPDTLGGMQQDLGQALQKLKPDLSMMEIMGIRKIADRALLLTRQFMTKNETIELIASENQLKQFNVNKIYTMTPRELMGSVHFFCTGLSESIDKNQNIDKLLKFTEITSKIPQMAQMTNYQEILKRIGLWLGFEDIDKFIQSNPMPITPNQPQVSPGVPNMPPQIARPPMPPGAMPPNGQMVRPPMPGGMPPNLQNLPPQLVQAIIQQMMQGRGMR